MSAVGQAERHTQNRIVKLFRERLSYEYLGNWEDRLNNSNIEEKELRKYLTRKNVSETLINRTLDKLRGAANNYNRDLYINNKEVYSLLRYGVKVKEDVGENYETVHLMIKDKTPIVAQI